MSAKPRPYDSFGRFILFKKLESDPIGELWRAGTIEGNGIGAIVAVRKLSGGNRAAMVRAAEHARTIVPSISGPTFVKNQIIDLSAEVPYLAHDYDGGRSLRYIVDKARGGGNASPNPIPIEQALAIVEKVAVSVETISNLKYGGTKLLHGALLPHFIWITDDGEVRTAGQQLGKGISQSLRVSDFAASIGGYVAPDVRDGAEPSRSSDVFSLGALLYLVLTGREPIDTADASAPDKSIQSATTMVGEPIPSDLKEVLQRSYTTDSARRYASAGDLREAIAGLFQSGRYAPSTFNLAFYLSTLLKKELEGEAIEREKELRVNVLPYLEVMTAPVPVAAATLSRSTTGPLPHPQRTPAKPPKKNAMPIYAGIGVALIAAGIAAYFFFSRTNGNDSASKLASAQEAAPPVQSAPVSAPIVAAAPPLTDSSATSAATPVTVDAAARKKLMEEEINRRLQQEMLKLQSEYDRSVQREERKPAGAASTAVTESRPPVSEPARTQAPPPISTPANSPVTATQPPAAIATTATAAAANPSPSPVTTDATSATREGDLIEYASVDRAPELTSPVRPVYPPLAARQKVEGTVIVSALVSEKGRVLDVKILRGDSKRMGLDEAAVRAIRGANFSPAMKDGKRVKTWKPIPIIFKLAGN